MEESCITKHDQGNESMAHVYLPLRLSTMVCSNNLWTQRTQGSGYPMDRNVPIDYPY